MEYITLFGVVFFVCTLVYIGIHVITNVHHAEDDLKKEITPKDEQDS